MLLQDAIKESDTLRNEKADLQTAILVLEQALKKHRDYSSEYFEATTKLAALYRDIGNTEKAESLYLKGISESKEANDIPATADLLRSLAFVRLQQTRYEEGTRNAEDALELIQSQPKSEDNYKILANVYALIGNLHFVQKVYDKAVTAYKQGLVFARKSGFIQREITLTSDLVNVQINIGKYDHALKTIDSTLPSADRFYKIAAPQLHLRKAKIFFMQKQNNNALESVNQAIEIAQKEGWKRDLAEAYELQGNIYENEDQTESAQAAYHQAISIFNAIRLSKRAEIIKQRLSDISVKIKN